MAELVVSGPEPMQRWRRPIPPGDVVCLGRAPRSGWAVPWDALISREHAELQMVSGQLRVRRLDSARNPIYHQDSESTDFLVPNHPSGPAECILYNDQGNLSTVLNLI